MFSPDPVQTRFALREDPECIELSLTGAFDAAAMGELRAVLDGLVAQSSPEVVLQLRGVDFIDSSGIGAIVYLYKRLRVQNRRLTLVGVQGQPRRLLELLRVGQIIAIRSESEPDRTVAAAPKRDAFARFLS